VSEETDKMLFENERDEVT